MSEDGGSRTYCLRLFVAGSTERSRRSIANLRRICAESVEGPVDLEVVDIYQQPALARENQVVAVPTLLKMLPLPVRRIVGDLSDRERVLRGLDLTELGKSDDGS